MEEDKQLATASSEERSKQQRPPSPKAAPWLVFPNGKGKKYQNFYNPCEPNNRNCRKTIPEMQGKSCYHKPSHQGWLIVIGDTNSNAQYSLTNSNFDDCFLWNPATLETIRLPNLNPRSFTRKSEVHYILFDLVLSSPPTSTCPDDAHDDGCMVFLLFKHMHHKSTDIGVDAYILVFCRPGDKQWRRKGLPVANSEHRIGRLFIESLVCFKGRLYAFCYDNWVIEIDIQKLWQNVVVDNQTQYKIRTFKVAEADFPVIGIGEEYESFVERWVESGNEIFKIHITGTPRGFRQLFSIHIFKLDFASMAWVLLKSMGDHVLFLCINADSCSDKNYFSTACSSAADMGLERGCLFYTLPKDQTLYIFEVEDMGTTVILPCAKLPTPWFLPTWIMMPTTVNRHVTGRRRRLEDFLFNKDSTETNIVDEQAKNVSTELRCLSPWLISIFEEDEESICNLIDPMHNNDKYLVKLPDQFLVGARIRFSKDGWLLLSVGKKKVFFFNPFTRATIHLPDLPDGCAPGGMSFSSVPTSPDCVVIAISNFIPTPAYIDISFFVTELGKSASGWTVHDFSYEYDDDLGRWTERFEPCNNPVFYNGAFYCLDYNGLLGVLHTKDGFSWEVLPKSLQQFSGIYPSFLVECDENLLLVHFEQSGKSVEVYRLDDSEMVWIKHNSLGKHALFISYTSSFSAVAPRSCMENKIYFSRLYGERILYYSLDTCRYHSVGNSHHASQDFYNTKERSNCSWIEPNWSQTSPT